MHGNHLHDVKGVIPFSMDDLRMVPRDLAAQGAMHMMTKIQQNQPAVAMASVAVLFYAWCRRTNTDPHDLYEQARRMVTSREEHHVKGQIWMDTLWDFAGIRLKGDAGVTI